MKTKITKAQFEQIEQESRIAGSFLDDEDFAFIRAYIETSLKSAEEMILNGTIHDVVERVTVTQSTEKEFTVPKEEQLQELRGQYKWIKKFLNDMRTFANQKEELNKAIREKKAYLEGEAGKDDITEGTG